MWNLQQDWLRPGESADGCVSEGEEVDLDPRAEFKEGRSTFDEPMSTIRLGPNAHQTTWVGLNTHRLVREGIERVLAANADLFAWNPADMLGIDPKFMCHKLALLPQARPVSQRKRKLGDERRTTVEIEVAQLARVAFIREVVYITWLENVVMVKKSNDKWRMCVDYTNLNKACPKDTYPLPSIDHLVDNTSGYGMLSFLNTYYGYNQIPMYPTDEDKTTFMTTRSNYCYQVMSFGLKNAGGDLSKVNE